MCFKPKITMPEVATPAQAPPPLDDIKPESLKFGGEDEDQKDLGGKTSNKKGKESLKIAKDKKPAATSSKSKTGFANSRG